MRKIVQHNPTLRDQPFWRKLFIHDQTTFLGYTLSDDDVSEITMTSDKPRYQVSSTRMKRNFTCDTIKEGKQDQDMNYVEKSFVTDETKCEKCEVTL